mmetsp:Transcript_34971/g.109781  ORF Transcript_34971/g.109781 Transcript_34971/m.109781 type:complete len:224 (-) Transcript_34971:444-1115(-)
MVVGARGAELAADDASGDGGQDLLQVRLQVEGEVGQHRPHKPHQRDEHREALQVALHLRLDELAQVGRVRVHRRLACHRAERAAEGGFVAALCIGVAPLRRLSLHALGGAVEGNAGSTRGGDGSLSTGVGGLRRRCGGALAHHLHGSSTPAARRLRSSGLWRGGLGRADDVEELLEPHLLLGPEDLLGLAEQQVLVAVGLVAAAVAAAALPLACGCPRRLRSR